MDATVFVLLELSLSLAGLVGVGGATGALKLTRRAEGLPTSLRLRLGTTGAFCLVLALALPFLSPVAVGPLRHHLGLLALGALVVGSALVWSRIAPEPSPRALRVAGWARLVFTGLCLGAAMAGALGELGVEIRPLGPPFWVMWALGVGLAWVLRRALRGLWGA